MIMVVMYLILVVGLPRLSNQKVHSILRVVCSLAFAAGLLHSIGADISDSIELKEFSQ